VAEAHQAGGRIAGHDDWRHAVRAAVAQATAHPARTMVWVDHDFTAWPLDDPGLIDALNGWVRRPGRQLTLVAAGFDALPRAHPRFVAWRQPWSHVVRGLAWEASATPPRGALLWADDGTWLRLHDDDPPRGAWGVGGSDAVHAHQAGDAIAQQSIASFFPTVTGL
jgi:hypothetical protein